MLTFTTRQREQQPITRGESMDEVEAIDKAFS